jgi:hypothetical protein
MVSANSLPPPTEHTRPHGVTWQKPLLSAVTEDTISNLTKYFEYKSQQTSRTTGGVITLQMLNKGNKATILYSSDHRSYYSHKYNYHQAKMPYFHVNIIS